MSVNSFSHCQLFGLHVLKQTQIFTLKKLKQIIHKGNHVVLSVELICSISLAMTLAMKADILSVTNVVMLIWLGHLPGLQK